MKGADGKWIGFGPGDKDPKIVVFKQKFNDKYKWVRDGYPDLGTSDFYTETLFNVASEFQKRVGLPITGIMNAASQERLGVTPPKPAVPHRPDRTFITCQGTVPSDMFGPPQGDIARGIADIAYHQPVWGRYAAFPMWSSITEEIAECQNLINDKNVTPGQFDMFGYSQGAIVVSWVYKYLLLPEPGPGGIGSLHHRLKDLRKVVTFGNPMMEIGKGWEDGVGKSARPNCGGIMEDRMVNTPSFWRDFAHRDDLYCDCENDDEGEFKRAICKIIMGNSWWKGKDSIFHQVMEVTGRPFKEVYKMTMAIKDAGLFFGSGTRPHVTYNPQAAIDFLRS